MKYFILFSLIFLAACDHKTGYRDEHSKLEEVTDIAKEVRVPIKMWSVLKGESSHGPAKEGHGEAPPAEEAGGHGGGGREGASKEGDSDEGFVFNEVKVLLTEKNPGIIRDKSVTLAFARGGGEIDLAQYVTENQGSFYVGFEFPEMEETEIKKVLFISHARKRKIDNQIFGAGCNEFYDITARFLKEMKGEGIKVNTTRKRHVSVLGGTFVISAQKGKQHYVTQVTFNDSSSPQLLCQVKQ